MKVRNEILHDLDLKNNIFITKPMMFLAVEKEIMRRNSMGHSFKCFVTSSTEMYEYKPGKFASSLDVLLSSFKYRFKDGKITNGTRVQLLVEANQHWTAVDLKFTIDSSSADNNKVSVFSIDAAGDTKYLKIINSVAKQLKELRPKIYQAAGSIQRDSQRCGVFSLHHALKCSLIGDLHENLLHRQEDFKDKFVALEAQQLFDKHNVSAVSFEQLPPSLIATTERSFMIEANFRRNPNARGAQIDEEGLTVEQAVWENTVRNEHRFENKYVQIIEEKMRLGVQATLESLTDEDLTSLFSNKKNMQRLSDERLPLHLPLLNMTGIMSKGAQIIPQTEEERGLHYESEQSEIRLKHFQGFKVRFQAAISGVRDQPLVADELLEPSTASAAAISSEATVPQSDSNEPSDSSVHCAPKSG